MCLDYFLRFLSREVVPGCETSSPVASRSESMGLSLNFGLRKFMSESWDITALKDKTRFCKDPDARCT